MPGDSSCGQFPLWTERREPQLEQHEGQQERSGVRGSGCFMLGGPAQGQGHGTRASWLERAWSPTLEACRSATLSLQSSCGRADWLALRLGKGSNRHPATHTPPSPDFPRFWSRCARRWDLTVFSPGENVSVRKSFLFYYLPSLAAGSVVGPAANLAPGVGPGRPRQSSLAAMSCHTLLIRQSRAHLLG